MNEQPSSDETLQVHAEAPPPTTTTEPFSESSDEDRFACNICFESVKSPVVTRCGHLHCWPCLYKWLEPGMTLEEKRYLDSSYVDFGSGLGWGAGSFPGQRIDETRRLCPVCKSGCSVKELVPIYVRDVNANVNANVKVDNVHKSEISGTTNEESNRVVHDDIDQECKAEITEHTNTNSNQSRIYPSQHEDVEEEDDERSDEFVRVDATTASSIPTARTTTEETLPEESSSAENNLHIDIPNLATATGLRRRISHQRQEGVGERIEGVSERIEAVSSQSPTRPFSQVPSRPLPPPSRNSPGNSNTSSINNSTSHHIPNSMNNNNNNDHGRRRRGIISDNSAALALHQSLFQALVTVQTQTNNQDHHPQGPQHSNNAGNDNNTNIDGSAIPSIHYRNMNRNTGEITNNVNIATGTDGHDGDIFRRDAATEFLSRLLLMLACFVVLCLLLF